MNRSWPADTTAREPHSGAAARSGLRDTRARGRRSRNRGPWRFGGQSIPGPRRRSIPSPGPCPGTALSTSRVAYALRGCDPAPAACPIRPVPGTAVVPATGCAPAPSTPGAGRCSPCRKIPGAVDRTQAYDAAVPPPIGPAMPAALRLALRRRWGETRSAPIPVLPWPLPRVPGNASRRCPSAPGCRSGCVHSGWLLQLPRLPFFLRTSQTARVDRLVQSVRQHVQFRRHFRHAPRPIEQLLRLFQHWSFQHRRRTVARRGCVEPLGAVVPIHLHIPLHRDHRHAKRLDDLFGFHRPACNHLAGEHAETPHVLLLVLEHRQVAVEVKHPARLFLYCDLVVDLRHPGRKNRQLKLRHSSLLPQLPPAPQVRLGIIPFSLPGKNHGARSGDLRLSLSNGCIPAVPASVSPGKVIVTPAPSHRRPPLAEKMRTPGKREQRASDLCDRVVGFVLT